MIESLKVPTSYEGIPFKLQRLYIKYLDCKAQTSEGIFTNMASRKWGAARRQFYRRTLKELLARGWARHVTRGESGDIALRSYQHVWRDMGIDRFTKKNRKSFMDKNRRGGSGQFYSFFKINLQDLDDDWKVFYVQINDIIQKHIAKRKRAQIRWRLNYGKKCKIDQTTFGSTRAALLFGYKSPSSGSKLRKKNFSIIETPEKPYFNQKNGRWENPCKIIAL